MKYIIVNKIYWGDFAQGDFVLGGFCLGGFCQGDFVLIPYLHKLKSTLVSNGSPHIWINSPMRKLILQTIYKRNIFSRKLERVDPRGSPEYGHLLVMFLDLCHYAVSGLTWTLLGLLFKFGLCGFGRLGAPAP